MRYTKLRKAAISGVAALSLLSLLAALFQGSQQTIDRASAKQDPQQDSRQDRSGTKRQWAWISDPPPFLELMEVKNLDSDNWMTDLEIKLKNTSEKPIYYVDFIVWTPDLRTQPDVRVNIHFEFGNRDLWYKEGPSAEDIFLKPGEEIVLSVKDADKPSVRKLFSYGVPQKGSLQDSTSKLEFHFHKTVIGDGEKYNGNQLISGKNREQSYNAPTPPNSSFTTLNALLPLSDFQFLDVKKKISLNT